ncbi:MAG: TonB-dependent receptor [Pseudomonadota bacterium]
MRCAQSFISPAVLITAITSLTALPASAQTSDEQSPSSDVVIVTGTRLPTPLDQVGRSVTVLTGADIELRQQQFLYDALAAVPGIQILRTGSFGSAATVSIRGLDSDQTLVVQDGVVVNDPSSFGNGFDFANFNASDIQRVEVIRGAQSTLYGSDAIGGVINIITKDGREGFGGDALLELGSFDLVRAGASIYGGSQTASGRVSVNAMTTNGFSSADEAAGNTEDDGFDNLTISTKGRYQPTDALRFDVVARYQDSENEFDSFSGGRPVDGDEVGETEELTIAGFATHTAVEGVFENKVGVTYLRNDRLNLTDGMTSFDALGTRISYEYQGTLKAAEGLSLVGGAEYDVQESEVTVGFGGNQEIKTTSGFGLIQLDFLDNLTLNVGARYDSSDEFGSETTFSASAAFTVPTLGTILRGSFSEGFRAPTAGELGFNPDLFAEFSEGWDVGLEQPLANGRVRLTTTYFDQSIDDLIAFDLGAFTFVNVQEFESKGVEIALDADVYDWLTFRGAYTYVDATNVTTTNVALNQPDHRLNAELAAQATERLTLSLGVNYNGSELDGSNTLDAFTLISVRGQYALNDKVELFVRVENATDADYQDNFGYGTAPLSAFGGVRTRF